MSAEGLELGYHRIGSGPVNGSFASSPDYQMLNSASSLAGCTWDCDLLLGPPPDLFLTGIPPPPPIPAFLRDPVEFLSSANGSCDLCHWAAGEDVRLVEVTTKYPVVDDVWYLVIVSAVIGAILFAILFVFAMFRCKEAKVKPLHDACSTSKVVEKKQQQHQHRAPDLPPLVVPCLTPGAVVPPPCSPAPKALWSALKRDGGYSLHHQPIPPELMSCNYEQINYGTLGSHTFGPPPARSPPPPPPFLPPPPLPPCRPYCAASAAPSMTRRPHHSNSNHNHNHQYHHHAAAPQAPLPSTVDEHGKVHIMGNGKTFYANPDSLDVSFENGGYVDSECNGLEVRKVAPDGAVFARRGSMTTGAGAGGVGVGGGGCGLDSWDEAILRQRVEAIPTFAAGCTPIPYSSFRNDRMAHQFILPPPGSGIHVSTKVSSPLV